jgi:peptidoglycan/xylan/chitin deacetylase (PgdA/CDA1 family)
MRFRLDRLATLYVANPIRRRISGRKPAIPILMYHSIADEDETGVRPYYRTATSPAVFAMHMQYLHNHGYRTLNLSEAVSVLQGEAARKCAVITFDDGYGDFYRHAFPVLDRYGFTATVFLPTAYIGATPKQFKGKYCLTWTEIRELRKHNVCFGSHTETHPQLRTLDAEAVNREVVNSKTNIEDNLGESVDSFSYPFSFPEGNASFIQMLRNTLVNSGYNHGVSTRIGVARQEEDRYFLPRLPINSLDDLQLFIAKLQGGYDWLHTLQYAAKFVRANVG